MKCFWCIDEIPEAAINRVTCPLRYNPPEEFCTYEVNEKPGGGEEASITYCINENVSLRYIWSFLLSEVIEKKGYDSTFEISHLLMKTRYSGPAAPH